MSPPTRRPCRFLSPSLPRLAALALAVAAPACSSGGGDGAEDTSNGGVGTGADGVTIFWWGYGGLRYGWGNRARPLDDGGYVAAGSRSRIQDSFDPRTYDAYLVRVGSTGELVWQRDLGEGGLQEVAYDVVAMTDGGFLIAGEAVPSQANPAADMFLSCVDGDGGSLWEARHGEDGFDSARAALEVPGGFLIAGARDSMVDVAVGRQAALLRVDAQGQLIWEELYGGEGFDEAWDLTAATSGGFALAGFRSGTPPDPVDQIWLVRTDGDGLPVWEQTYGDGHAYGVCATDDDGFVLTGFVLGENETLDLVVLRTNADGSERWRRVFGGADDDCGRSVEPRPGGGFLVAGYTQSFTSGSEPWARQDIYLLALDQDGGVIFQKVKGKAPDSSERAESVVATPDGGMILCGSWAARLLLMKADKNGDTIKLGDQDVSLQIPDVTEGLIGFADTLPVAKAAVDLLFVARQIGPFATENLIAVLSGTTPAQMCPLGGTFSTTPFPVPPLAGQTFHVEFASCQTAPPESMLFDGSYDFSIDALTGNLIAPPYVLSSRVTDVQITVVDDGGTKSGEAYMSLDRSGAGPET